MPNAVIAHAPDGEFDLDALKQGGAAAWPGLDRHGPGAEGDQRPALRLGRDVLAAGARATAARPIRNSAWSRIDYGVKRNILRLLADAGCKVTVVPARPAPRTSSR